MIRCLQRLQKQNSHSEQQSLGEVPRSTTKNIRRTLPLCLAIQMAPALAFHKLQCRTLIMLAMAEQQ